VKHVQHQQQVWYWPCTITSPLTLSVPSNELRRMSICTIIKSTIYRNAPPWVEKETVPCYHELIAVQSRTGLENRCKTTQNLYKRENWTTDCDKDGEFSRQLWNQFTNCTWSEFQLYWGGFWHAGPLIPSLSASSHKTGTQFDAFFKEALKAYPCLLQLAIIRHRALHRL